jgi:hypothetical protein
MSRLEVVLECVWWLTIAGHLLLFLRLRVTGLHRSYRYFSAYLLFRVLRAILLIAVPWGVKALQGRPNVPFATNAYRYIWAVTEPVLWVFWVLVVLELYSLVLQNFKGIASLGRWVLLTGLAIAVAISFLTLQADLSNPGEKYPTLRLFFAMDRGVASSLVIFLLVISCFLAWYPVPLSRNVVVHCIVYAGYFLSMTLTLLLRNLVGNSVTAAVSIVVSCVTLVCLVVWIGLLNREGESARVRLRPRLAEGHEEELVGHLAAINSTLLRAARK